MIIIGIDPGSSGGIAWNEPEKGIQAVKMPATETEVVALLYGIRERTRGKESIRAYCELVTGYVKHDKDDGEENKNRQPGHTMFKFGRGVGVLQGACLAIFGKPMIEVHPNVWQKPLFVPKGSKTERKNYMKRAAQRRYPQLKVTLSTADALLIRAYGEMLSASERKGVNSCVFRNSGQSDVSTTLREELEASAEKLFLAEWDGRLHVFQGEGNQAKYLRPATDQDKCALTRGGKI